MGHTGAENERELHGAWHGESHRDWWHRRVTEGLTWKHYKGTNIGESHRGFTEGLTEGTPTGWWRVTRIPAASGFYSDFLEPRLGPAVEPCEFLSSCPGTSNQAGRWEDRDTYSKHLVHMDVHIHTFTYIAHIYIPHTQIYWNTFTLTYAYIHTLL